MIPAPTRDRPIRDREAEAAQPGAWVTTTAAAGVEAGVQTARLVTTVGVAVGVAVVVAWELPVTSGRSVHGLTWGPPPRRPSSWQARNPLAACTGTQTHRVEPGLRPTQQKLHSTTRPRPKHIEWSQDCPQRNKNSTQRRGRTASRACARPARSYVAAQTATRACARPLRFRTRVFAAPTSLLRLGLSHAPRRFR